MNVNKNDQKEKFSMIYVSALATRAGYATSSPMPDRDSVDLSIHDKGQGHANLDMQLKATTTLNTKSNHKIPYVLRRKNYDDLRDNTQVPRLLVVLELPDEENWMSITEEELILRRRAYWLSLQNPQYPFRDQQTVTVHFDPYHILNVDSLQTLMKKSQTGEI